MQILSLCKILTFLTDGKGNYWFDDGGDFNVIVRVMPEIAHNFKLKDFLSSQEILEEYDDGSIIVKFDVTSDEDVDNLIKSWLPHIEILEPERLRKKFNRLS